MAVTDKDDVLIDDVENTFRNLYRRYRRAGAVEQGELADPLSRAATAWVKAQLKLAGANEIATQKMIEEMHDIKNDINKAVKTQELLIAVGRFVAFIAAI